MKYQVDADKKARFVTATSMGKHFDIPAPTMNWILSELGWIRKDGDDWLLTEAGKRHGGLPLRHEESRKRYVQWPESILNNIMLTAKVREVSANQVSADAVKGPITLRDEMTFTNNPPVSRRCPAAVYGASGAWLEIVRDMQQAGLVAADPGDIEPLIGRLQETLAAKHSETDLSVHQRNEQIGALKSETRLIQRIRGWFRVRRLQSEITKLLATESQCARELDQRISRLEQLLTSPELAGAIAELAVIEQLRLLPESYVVVNDVRLLAQPDRPINFHERRVYSAQIDHVVLAPSGVFVIETKCWSPRFAASREYDDPYEQVGRARYLCHRLLTEQFGTMGTMHVRSIIVSLGELPPQPEDSFARVLGPMQLCAHVCRFKDVELRVEQLEALTQYFKQRIHG